MRNFFDLNMHAYPENEVKSEELLCAAKKYGYAGIAITNHDNTMLDETPDNLFPSSEELDYNSIFSGIEIRASSVHELKRKIKDWRKRVLILVVHGGEGKINKAAVKNSKIDILAHPFEGKGNLDPVLVRYAAENNIAIEFNINAIIHSRRFNRSRILRKMHQNLKLLRKYKAKMIITSNAHSLYDIRAPREMIALASLFGMRKEEAISALSDVPEAIMKKKWKKEKEVEVLFK